MILDVKLSKSWLKIAIAAVFAGQGMMLSLALSMTPPEFGTAVYWVLRGADFIDTDCDAVPWWTFIRFDLWDDPLETAVDRGPFYTEFAGRLCGVARQHLYGRGGGFL